MFSLESNQKSTATTNVNLYTALAIFVNNAPQLIDDILDAANAENLRRVEETAAKLSLYSNDAQLTGFRQNVHNLIIAARERKLSVVKSQAEKLKGAFEQLTKFADTVTPEQEILF
jgi:hypothetical protein